MTQCFGVPRCSRNVQLCSTDVQSNLPSRHDGQRFCILSGCSVVRDSAWQMSVVSKYLLGFLVSAGQNRLIPWYTLWPACFPSFLMQFEVMVTPSSSYDVQRRTVEYCDSVVRY
jgi:hypothetical protein